jgi:cell division protein ZapA
MSKKTAVRVKIAGEEYPIRSDAPAEHTRHVAAYVDNAIKAVLNGGVIVETHKAAILAAMQITDQLFRSREQSEMLAEQMRTLTDEMRRWLPPAKRDNGE